METAATKELTRLFEGIRDERRMYANTATRIGNAFLSLLSYLADAPFIRKDSEDDTAYLLHLLAGAVIGESKQISLNPDGSIHCGRITVEGSAVFNELVFNHQNVLEGDTYFTDRGIIETVEQTDLTQYRLTFRKQYDNDHVTFHVSDVMKCSMNNLDAAKSYRTSWMRVDKVDMAANTVTVTLYPDSQVPGGVNSPPEASARCIRWGNVVDKDRQQTFFVSSQDGTFLFLQGVDAPIVKDSSTAAFLGIPPELEQLKNLPIDKRQPYIYARGLIVQDIIRVDYLGNPTYTIRDCGRWNNGSSYIHGYDEKAKGYYTDRVWNYGCLWQCAVDKSTMGLPPRPGNTEWVCLMGDGNTSIDILSTAGDSFQAGTQWTTDLVAIPRQAELELTEEDVGRNNITWLRISDDANGDTSWNIRHPSGSVGLRLHIASTEDLPSEWKAGSQVGFRCIVTLPDTDEPIAAEYSIYQ